MTRKLPLKIRMGSVLLLLLLLTFYTLSSHSVAATNTAAPQFKTTRQENLVSDILSTYVNRNYGIKFQYPSNWNVVGKSALNNSLEFPLIVGLRSPHNNNSELDQETMQVGVIQSNTTMSPFEAHGNVENYLSKIVPTFNSTNTAQIILDGHPVIKETFTTEKNRSLNTWLVYTIPSGNKAFFIVYPIKPLIYSKYSLILKNIINSFVNLSLVKSVDMSSAGIIIGNIPSSIAVNPNTNKIYISIQGSDTVSVINGYTDRAVANITVPPLPVSISVDPNSNRVFVTSTTNVLSIIDGSTNTILRNITLPGLYPYVVIDLNGFLYVENHNATTQTNNVTKLDQAGQGIGGIALQGRYQYFSTPTDMIVDEFGDVYVYNIINKEGVVSKIPVGLSNVSKNIAVVANILPVHMVYNPTNGLIYVSQQTATGGKIYLIDSTSDTALNSTPIEVGSGATNMAINPDTNKIYVVHDNSNNVTVIDGSTNNVNKTIAIGAQNYRNLIAFNLITIAVNPKTDLIYVVNRGSDRMFVIDGSTDKLIVGETFHITPTDFGFIKCVNNQNNTQSWIISDNEHIHFPFGMEVNCQAIAKGQMDAGFEPLSSLLYQAHNLLFGGIKFNEWSTGPVSSSNDNTLTFNASKYDTITADFIEVPPSIDTLIAIIATAIAAGPLIWGWLRSRRKSKQAKYVSKYIKIINEENNMPYKNKEQHLKSLEGLRDQIRLLYGNGALDEPNYEVLRKKISGHINQLYNDTNSNF
jgi:YVTN family beta-propeller protein